MRILLIKAFRKTRSSDAVTHPLGLMYLASVLRKRGIDKIQIVDTRVLKDPYRTVSRKIEEFRPDVVGISALTVEADCLQRVSAQTKRINSRTLVVAGGPHASAYYKQMLEDRNIDIAVYGEGEETFAELCTEYAGNGKKDYQFIAGIAYRDDKGIHVNPPREYIGDVDSIPFPAWDLVDLEPYSKRKSMASLGYRPYMSMMTSRACPFKCIYCHNIFGKNFRSRSPQNILDEMLTLRNRYGITEFEILDDVFNLDRKRADQFYDLVIERFPGARIAYPNGLRTDMLDEEAIRKMSLAGVVYVAVAIESANERLQKLMKKYLNLKKAFNAIEYYYKYGIFTNGFFMLGFPTETREEIMNTIRFACNSKLNSAQFFIVTPFHGTELAELYKERVSNFKIDFSKYEYYLGEFNLSNVSDSELFRLQRLANLKFYLNPWRLYNIWSCHPRKSELLKYLTIVPKRIIWFNRGGRHEQNPSY